MKLTNEAVAKALGWKCVCQKVGHHHIVTINGKRRTNPNCIQPPPFTTSLDAIVAEAKALKAVTWILYWMGNQKSESPAEPLSWCKGLMAYLKPTRPTARKRGSK